MDPIILPRVSVQKPLVSVVSITYNHEPYIRDCLEGFLMQKTNFPVEYIIHDDASTDHTADIIREYYEKRPDLFHVIIERENLYSQKKPIVVPLYEMAQGKYIAVCEGDDYWTDPLKLQKQFDFMEANPDYSCCFHNAIIKNQKEGTTRKYYMKSIKEEITLSDTIKGDGGLMPSASIFFRTDKIKDYASIKEFCPVGDYPLAICLAKNGKIRHFDSTMSTYRVGIEGSWSARTSNKTKAIALFQEMLSWLDYLNSNLKTYQEDIDYIKGKYCSRILEIEGKYKQIKNNQLAMYFIKKQPLWLRMKYYIKYTFPITLTLKKYILFILGH